MRRFRIHGFVLMAVALAACASNEGEQSQNSTARLPESPGTADYYNQVERIASDYVTRFDDLPLAGKVSRIPWTDTYWPKNKGGITYRWQTGESHDYASPSRDEALAMSSAQLGLLSPSEKLDLIAGNYHYALTEREKSRNTKSTPSWQGYCHGWTPASIHFEEPLPVVVQNPDGLEIPFGSSDIKALLSYYQGEVVQNFYATPDLTFVQPVHVMGSVCSSNSPVDSSCFDVNPGSFHVVMSNQIALRDEAFGIDATNTAEKWNQPVHTFSSEVLLSRSPREGANPLAVEEHVVRSRVIYTQEIEPQWEATSGTSAHADHEKTYTYSVEVDGEGHVVGGQWLYLGDGHEGIALHAAVKQLRQEDTNGDGVADHSEDEMEQIIWHHFDFPDYVWKHGKQPFSETFVQAPSAYAFLAPSATMYKNLYGYFAKLGTVYEASMNER